MLDNRHSQRAAVLGLAIAGFQNNVPVLNEESGVTLKDGDEDLVGITENAKKVFSICFEGNFEAFLGAFMTEIATATTLKVDPGAHISAWAKRLLPSIQ